MTLEIADALVSGIPIGVGQTAACDVCGQTLRPNDRVEVLVVIDGADIWPATCRCSHCAKSEIHPQTVRPCWLATGRLVAAIGADGRSEVILSGADVIDRNG